MVEIPFMGSPTNSLGIELELQLIDLATGDLSNKSIEIIEQCGDEEHVKKELTLSTVELNSSVHENPFTLYEEMNKILRNVAKVAAENNCGLCGGGRHFSNIWKTQAITPTERYTEVHQHLGFLAKLSCVFGQHIHVGVKNGDDAIYLCHALIPYLPHFIALSASSPFYQSEDTQFASSRFSSLNSFHTFGYIERDILKWPDFVEYVEECSNMDVIRSLKDIYWEIRPKPELGTIEIRVCDTPLTLFHATMLGGYAQILVKYLLNNRAPITRARDGITSANIFHAQRYDFEARYIDTEQRRSISLKTHLHETLLKLEAGASDEEKQVLSYLKTYVQRGVNDARMMRERVKEGLSEFEVIQEMMHQMVPKEHITHSERRAVGDAT